MEKLILLRVKQVSYPFEACLLKSGVKQIDDGELGSLETGLFLQMKVLFEMVVLCELGVELISAPEQNNVFSENYRSFNYCSSSSTFSRGRENNGYLLKGHMTSVLMWSVSSQIYMRQCNLDYLHAPLLVRSSVAQRFTWGVWGG